MSRFREGVHTLLGKKQTAIGTPATPVGTDAIAAMELDVSPNIESTEDKYAQEDSRDTNTSVTDITKTAKFKHFFPSAGTAGTAPVLSSWLEACGSAKISVAGTSVEASNSQGSGDAMTLAYELHDLASAVKQALITDARGTVDLEMELGSRCMMNFTYSGEHNDSTDEGAITADFGTQKQFLAPRIRKSNITICKLQPLLTGSAVVANDNVCFGKLQADNLFGFDLARYQLSCDTGFDLTPKPGQVKLTILEDNVAANWNPEAELEKYHSFTVKWGTTAGALSTILFSKLQLVDYAPATLGPWRGTELTFNSVGTTSLIFS